MRFARMQRPQGRGLDRLGQADALRPVAQPAHGAFQYIRARIADAIDPMAEAHQPLAPVQRVADPALGARGGADRIEHVQHRPPGAPPCSGPFNAQSPATMEEGRPAAVDATTRAAKVEALSP